MISIILPTFNRADVIGRAIKSVQAQTFTDWELIIVDDGSTDDTAMVVRDLDPRIRYIYQDNKGVSSARNTGLDQSRGQYIAFLDSDDEWLPHFLEITIAFLKWSSEDHFVTTELLEDWGNKHYIRQDIHKISTKFTKLARAVGSKLMDLPAGENDRYLSVYSTREPLGEWGNRIAEQAGYTDAALYRGNILKHMRWGYLNWLPVTVMTRHAFETIGPFVANVRSAEDYRFLAQLYRHFRANMISLPGAIKHAFASGKQPLAQGHLATGIAEYQFAVNKLKFFDEVFQKERQDNAEINRIRGHYQYYTACTALELGMRSEALMHLKEARGARSNRFGIYGLTAFLYFVPSGHVASSVYSSWRRVKSLALVVISGEMSLSELLGRVLGKLRMW